MLSVTATQLTMWLVHSGLNVSITRGRMRIYKGAGTPGVTSVVADDFMDFRIPPWVELEENYDYPFDPPVMRGGDSMSFLVVGYDPGGINQLRLDTWNAVINAPTVVNEDIGLLRIFATAPPTLFFGAGPIMSPDAQQMVPMSFTVNERAANLTVRAFRVPSYEVTGFTPATIDLSAGTQITISGVNMPGQVLVRWIQGTTELISTANGCASACNSVTAPPPAGIVPGTYEIVVHLSLFTDLTLVGLGNVTVVP